MSWNDVFDALAGLPGLAWTLTYNYASHHPWTVAVALYGLARAFGVVIQSGQRGVLFRWGRAAGELEPGFHWLIPIVDGVKKTPVRSVTIDLPNQKVMTADGLVYDVGVNVVYRVNDATKAMTLVDHVDAGCRTAIPIIVTEVIHVRDQAALVDRVSLDRKLFERMNTWVARWGLVIEQAGFTTIAPNRGVLRTTQLRPVTRERAGALRLLMAGSLDAGAALVMIGTDRQLVPKASRRYHQRKRTNESRTYKAWKARQAKIGPVAAATTAPKTDATTTPETKPTDPAATKPVTA